MRAAIAEEVNETKTTPTSTSPPAPETALLASWQPEPIDWLWFPYVPKGMLTMLSGVAGAGKTCIALDIAAAVTSGRAHIDEASCAPANVLYLTSGDNIANVVRPRFDAAGGDAQRFRFLRDPEKLTKPEDLEVVIKDTGAALVIIDTLQSYFGTARCKLEKLS